MTAIDPKQAIRNAIEAELAAERFYRLLAESTDDEDSRAFLEEMATQERDHATAIETMGGKIVDGPLPDHAVGKVEGIETLPSWRFVDGISLDDALDVALAAERQAALYYDVFAEGFEGEVRKFFEDLAECEEDHARRIEKRLAAS
jgi:rubrerythrin